MFEELDFRRTKIGDISLRRRTELSLGVDVLEIKLGDEFLMSSLFTEGEIELARLGLRGLPAGPLDVAVGGLGLGYTAVAALAQENVRSLLVIEAIPEVIEWHRRGLIPAGAQLTAESRCHLALGDFFALAASPGLDARSPLKRFHAVLLDIDHSPRGVLHPSHASFYEPDGLRRLAAHLHPGGVFALWSNEVPDDGFLTILGGVFARSIAHEVKFHNPLQNREAVNTVYVAQID